MEPKEMPQRKVSLEDKMRPAMSITPDTPARGSKDSLGEQGGGDAGG
jgi:hypothetical protein